jgi:hypothetical protein
MTVEEMIQHGHTTAAFLKSTTGEAVFEELGQIYFAEFKSATTPEQRELSWAKARALDDLKTALQAIVDTGTFEQTKIDQAAARTQRP